MFAGERCDAVGPRSIQRIVGDKNCLCYFVQFLEQKLALPKIKFWLDAESFRSSADACVERSAREAKGAARLHRRAKSLGGRSGSFECDSNGFSDDVSLSSELDGATLGLTRDSGDGSSDANSMTNLSDICEHEEQPPLLQADEVDKEDDAQQEVCENGRKSAIGASSDDGEPSEGQTPLRLRSLNLHASLALDAMRIFKKYLINRKSPTHVDIPATILSQISLALCYDRSVAAAAAAEDDCSLEEISRRGISPSMPSIATIFDAAQHYVLDQIDATYTRAFLESPFYCRYCVDVLSGDGLRITDILHNEAAIFYFLEFLEVDGQRRYLDFWLAASNFRQQMAETGDGDASEAQNDALILYEKFFSLQASCPLSMSDRVRFQVEEKICSVDGAAGIATCFDFPLAVVESFLEKKHLRPFVKSPLFFRYLSELLQRLDAGKAAEKPSAAPRKSISAQNTLLAVDGSRKRPSVSAPPVRPSATMDMNIDARQLRDPDMLWRRSDLNGLNFGRVDALGRYERDYDMAPFGDRHNLSFASPANKPVVNSLDTGIAALQTTGNKIKQAVRKLVHLPEDKIQEEIAWQVAEMIVRDITNITLSPTDSPSLPE